MKLDITYHQEPISVLGRFEPEPPMLLEKFEVKIDGKLCPPQIRDIILMGMSHQAGFRPEEFICASVSNVEANLFRERYQFVGGLNT